MRCKTRKTSWGTSVKPDPQAAQHPGAFDNLCKATLVKTAAGNMQRRDKGVLLHERACDTRLSP